MIGASKILTVSYGTFSCTLEGFDDPFNTMRAIAEYFRDLAAEDRYFGAEPPTPDAAMLHRIAEREINRRVEANVQENGVILRAEAGPARVAPAETRPAPLPTATAILAPAKEQADADEPDSVANRLLRLREAQALVEDAIHPAAAPMADDAEVEAAVPTEPWSADTLASVMAELAEPLPPEPAPLQELRPEQTFAAAEPEFADHAKAQAPTREAEPAAADLDVAEPNDADGFEPEPEAEATPEPAEVIGEPAAEVIVDPAPEPNVETAVEAEAGVTLEPALGVIVDPAPEPAVEAEAGVTPEPALGVIFEPAAEDATLDQTADQPALTASDAAILQATLGAMIDPDGDEDFVEPAPVAAETAIPRSEPAAIADTGEAGDTRLPGDERTAEPFITPPADDPQAESRSAVRMQRARARVIKIRRIEAAKASEPAPVAEPAPALQPALESGSDTAASALSPEAEAELMRELADLEADLAPSPAAQVEAALTEDLQPEAVQGVLPTEDLHTGAAQPAVPVAGPQPAPSAADDAVNRLISQTNAAMAGPENKRRLAAIAHLKAAVAATFADRRSSAAASAAPVVRMDPYRDDLDRVVRPRRPALIAPSGDAAPQPSVRPQIDTRPAPLVLVSEQRIDRPSAPADRPMVTPVRPRRVTSDMIAIDARISRAPDVPDAAEETALTEDDVNNIFSDPNQPFAEFADRVGAVTMTDLIEAAAAYCALQLGRDQFTRPLLLQQIADIPTGGAFNREDCLRGFGTLLRDGRIEKIRRGQFRLSGHSRYLAGGKRQAG